MKFLARLADVSSKTHAHLLRKGLYLPDVVKKWSISFCEIKIVLGKSQRKI